MGAQVTGAFGNYTAPGSALAGFADGEATYFRVVGCQSAPAFVPG